MKKILGVLVAVLIVAVIVIAVFLLGKLDDTIADTIQTEGTAAIGTAVTVVSVETKLTDGVAIINGLAVANPPGYKAAHALRIKSFTAKVDYESQIIESVIIDKPVINAELIGTKSNFQDLLDGMPEDEEVTPDGTESDEEELELTIKKLALRQALVNIDSDKLGQTSFVMDDLVFNDLTGTVDQLSDEITNRLINHVTSQVKAFATAEITKLIKAKAIEKVEEKVTEKINEEISEKLNDKLGDQLGGKLKNLKFKFGRKKD